MIGNQFTVLPDGLFEGLNELTQLRLQNNSVDPLPLTVSLEKVDTDQFKAVAPAGAPFEIGLPLSVVNGSISGGATTITIPAGSVESAPLTVTRTPGTTFAVTVEIGTLPGLPRGHSGYALVKSADLPLVLTEFGGTVLTPVCDRTPQVRRAIVAAVSGVSNCRNVTEAHLAAITKLDLEGQAIPALQVGDFDGLTALTELWLKNNQLSALPVGVFDHLTALTTLSLWGNQLSALPAGIFDHLTALTTLYLQNNQLSSLPAGIFDHLTALTRLDLNENRLSALPAGIFDHLTALTLLRLDVNQLSSLPAGIFDHLNTLTLLYLYENQLSALPAGIFDHLNTLTFLHLSSNQLSALPAGIFDHLTALTTLLLHNNSVNPLPLAISLEKVGEDQFKAIAPSGAPFEIVLPLTVANGTIDGGATTIAIPAGSVESQPLTVTRTPGTTFAVTVDIGTLPGLPSGHGGYALVKSADLPLTLSILWWEPPPPSATAPHNDATSACKHVQCVTEAHGNYQTCI